MLTLQEIHGACIRLGDILADPPASRAVLSAVAMQLETLSYDLAWAIAEAKAVSDEARNPHPAQSALTSMDEQLTRMQSKYSDGQLPGWRDELEAVRQSALVVLSSLTPHDLNVTRSAPVLMTETSPA